MSFLQWTFLFGALAVVGPLMAHLLSKPRFRRVPFTMLRFLRSGQRESQSRRKLRDLLVLLLRCAIITLIALLFAQPLLHVHSKPQEQRTVVHLALDDSMSMAYRDGGKSLLARMIEAADKRIGRAPQQARFSIHTLASRRHIDGLDKRQARAEIKRLTVTPKSAQLADFLSALRQGSRQRPPGTRVRVCVLSDFAPNILRQFEQVLRPAGVHEWTYESLRPNGKVSNAAITGARVVDATGGTLDIDVTVSDWSDTAQERKLTATVPDLETAGVDVHLAPGQQQVLRIQVELQHTMTGSHRPVLPVELDLSPADNLVEDDTYRLAVSAPAATSTHVLLVHRADEAFLFETALDALARKSSAWTPEVRTATEDHVTSGDLNWADTVVFSSLPADLRYRTEDLENVAARGGRVVFFATDVGNSKIAERLWREGLLCALPQRWAQETVYLEAQPCTRLCPGFDDRTARSLSNYRPDRIAARGCWLCRVAPQTQCIWRFKNGQGFLWHTSVGRGSAVLVNTSIDDSLGLLAKSGAWVAFCGYLLGEDHEAKQFCFSTAEQPVLSVSDSGRTRQRLAVVPVENCDGSKTRARIEGDRLFMPAPAGLGWMRTLGATSLYAGINLPAGETDMGSVTTEQVADALTRAFVTETPDGAQPAGARQAAQRKPVWPSLAWAIIFLVLLESTVTSRLKR